MKAVVENVIISAENLRSYKIFIFLLIILKFPIRKDHQEGSKLHQLFQQDLALCPECFQHEIKECLRIENEIEFTEGFEDSLNIMFGVRQTRYGIYNSTRTVIKYLFNDYKGIYGIIKSNRSTMREELIDQLFDSSRIEGLQMCSRTILDNLFGRNSLSNIVHLNVDAQPLILPILYKHHFPVPKVLQTCGFTIYESYEGRSLTKFYNSPFDTRLQITIQLLRGVLNFTEGFNGFKIYLTDLNPDNIVYNPETNKLTFVDLDDIIIVDSKENTVESHRHEMIECDGCFAYSQQSICAAKSSDINLFAACQFLLEDLKRDKTKGFLYPDSEDILEEFRVIYEILSDCVDCKGEQCESRFDLVNELIEIFEEVRDEDIPTTPTYDFAIYY
ncbi:C3orf58 family protein [Megaselia abdita]